MEVECTGMPARVVVEAVHEARREDDERAGWKGVRGVAYVERELAFEDEERVGVLAMDVRRRAALAASVVELGDRELVGLDGDRVRALVDIDQLPS